MKVVHSLLAMSALWISAVSFADAPSTVEIRKINAAGTGCPQGSAYINISPDRQVFTAIFDKFQAQIDPNNPAVSYADRQKRCDLAVNVRVPAGWQFSVFQADYEGWFDMQRGMTMTQTSTYHFQGNARHVKMSSVNTNAGPRNGNFHFVDQVGVSSYEWSACGGPRNLFLTSEIRLASNNPYSAGVAGIDSIEGKFTLKAHFGIMWRRC